MSSELKAKLAQVASRIAATQERLRGLERSAASLRHDLESLRSEVEQQADTGAAIDEDDFDHRVPTQPLAVGGFGGKRPPAGGERDATAVEARAADDPAAAAAPTADEPWPQR